MSPSNQFIPFADRAELPSISPLARYLLTLISIKHSNLCVSADVHNTNDLLQVAEEVGDYICVLKTHVDIIDDFSERTIRELQKISQRKHFLIFEDRKFGDIGSKFHSIICQIRNIKLNKSLDRHPAVPICSRSPSHSPMGASHKRPPLARALYNSIPPIRRTLYACFPQPISSHDNNHRRTSTKP